MEEKIAALRAELEADLAAVHNKDELSAFWQKYLKQKRQRDRTDQVPARCSQRGTPRRR